MKIISFLNGFNTLFFPNKNKKQSKTELLAKSLADKMFNDLSQDLLTNNSIKAVKQSKTELPTGVPAWMITSDRL